jgi:hypothetical protein
MNQRTCLTVDEVVQKVGIEEFLDMVLTEMADPGYTQYNLEGSDPRTYDLDPLTFPYAGYQVLVDKFKKIFDVSLIIQEDETPAIRIYKAMIDICIEKEVKTDQIEDIMKLWFAYNEEDDLRDLSSKDVAWAIVHGELPDYTEIRPMTLIQDFLELWDEEEGEAEEHILKEFRAMFNEGR